MPIANYSTYAAGLFPKKLLLSSIKSNELTVDCELILTAFPWRLLHLDLPTLVETFPPVSHTNMIYVILTILKEQELDNYDKCELNVFMGLNR